MWKGFLNCSKSAAQTGPCGAARHAASGDSTLIKRPPTARLSRSQLASDGRDGSPGRTRRNGSAASFTEFPRIAEQPAAIIETAAAPLRRYLLFIAFASPAG